MTQGDRLDASSSLSRRARAFAPGALLFVLFAYASFASSAILADRKAAHPSIHQILRELDSLLPEETDVRRVSLSGTTLQVQGQSDDATALVQRLRAATLFGEPKLQGEVFPDNETGKEQFLIAATATPDAACAAAALAPKGTAFLAANPYHAVQEVIGQLRRTVAKHARPSQPCEIIMTELVPPAGPESFERVTFMARLRCTGEELLPILEELETSKPTLFLDEIQIWKQVGYRRPESAQLEAYLDVQFNVYGYFGGDGAQATP